MPARPRLQFARVTKPAGGVAIVFADAKLAVGPRTAAFLGAGQALLRRAAEAEGFKGKQGATLDIVAPHGLALDRLVVVGIGDGKDFKSRDLIKLGGGTAGKIPGSAKSATVIVEKPGVDFSADEAAQVALGLKLRLYRFDRYKTRRKDDEDATPSTLVSLSVAAEAAVRKAWRAAEAVGEGVYLARDLVNEPPNVLFPAEFARRATALRKLGVEVQVFDDKAMKKLGMNALLGVGQGSQHESRMVILRWNGGRPGQKPLAIVGKGVTFDTGGISIKPAGSMEDMKGDMAGAACVLGLMHALAARKAKANVIGAIGLVENMPDGNAQRPGDIVTSMSGQTIEIINTDAEGRLVLGDVLWYVDKKLKPAAMIDLATLTGAIMVALGHEHAGLFSNDDALAAKLAAAGEETGEKVWRLPLAPEYDKLIDSKFADMKNTGGRNAGSITAAQFLKRFVGDTPWAHLDIAGTGFGAGSSDISRSWGPGWGVRLLDRLIAAHLER